jgi:protein gp37
MGETSIEWTDRSLNPFRARLPGRGTTGGYDSGVGHCCEKISAGCTNCYSSATQPRFGLPQFQKQRRAGIESFLDPSKLTEVLRRKAPTKWFWCDMTDMFGDWIPFEWIAACFGVMAATPQHTHQVLTKRPARALEFFAWLGGERNKQDMGDGLLFGREWVLADAYAEATSDGSDGDHQEKREHIQRLIEDSYRPGHDEMLWPLLNVHLGVSTENQETADERIPLLLQCPAAVRWVSAEPLLGPVSVADLLDGRGGIIKPLVGLHWEPCAKGITVKKPRGPQIDWVVVGGESGPGARACDLAWIRSIVQQCKAASCPVFVKQLGSRPIESMDDIRGGYGDGHLDLSPKPLMPGWTRVQEKDRARIFRYIHPKSAKGGDISEFPEDLKVREFPR